MEMFYLTTHLTYFIYCYMALVTLHQWKCLIYNTLNTFYLWLYDIGNTSPMEMFYLTTHLTHFIYGYMALVTLRQWKSFI